MNSGILDKFEFLFGEWNLEYRIPKSTLSDAGSDTGIGSFKKILSNNYVLFEYSTKSGSEAKGIFMILPKIRTES